MAERKTLARPYAKAVFGLARETDTVARWGDLLSFYAIAMQDAGLLNAMRDPRPTADQKQELLYSLYEGISDQEKALIDMLLENGKLELLPEISALFNQRRAEVEGTVSAEVISAYELDDSQIEALAGALKNELKRDVVIETSVDSSIIGGVIIRAGDTVIDGSVAGKLKDLTSYLTR